MPQWTSTAPESCWCCIGLVSGNFNTLLALCEGNPPCLPIYRFNQCYRLSTNLYICKKSIHLDPLHDDVIKCRHFPRYWPFVRGIHRSQVNSPHKGQWRVALMFSLIFVWINGSVNNREAGDFRRHRAHYDVIVMFLIRLALEAASALLNKGRIYTSYIFITLL